MSIWETGRNTSQGFVLYTTLASKHPLALHPFRWQARIPLDVIFGSPTSELRTTSQHILNLGKSLEQAYELARDHLQKDKRNVMIGGYMANPTRWEIKSGCTIRLFQGGVQRSYISHGLAPFKLSNTCQTLPIKFKIHRDEDGEQ